MRLSATMTGLSEALKAADRRVAKAATTAMRGATGDLKQGLRDQVTAAGFSDRLARTWQGKTFPERRESSRPAAYVFSKAPGIIDAYARGATIVAKSGRRFLAIPTEDVPRKRQGNALTPAEVESRYGRRLQFVNPADRGFHTPSVRRAGVAYLVMKGLVVRKATGRWRNASQREQAGRTRNPRPVQSVIMFTLVPQVKVAKRLDLSVVLNKVAGELPARIEESWARG